MAGFSLKDEDFRDEVRRFLDANLTAELRAAGRMTTGVFTDWPVAKKWHQILYRKGWAAPAWPKEYGGTGWSVVQRYISASELAAAEAPKPAGMGIHMVGPIVMRYGREDQKRRYLIPLLSGDDFWCQGYSEPGSGSDLASLQMRAVSDGDDYIINGSKIWTTHAQWANRMFCLVRTSTVGKPQAGITFLLLDMDTKGIKVEPIITMAGDHEVNQVFFDDVRVPKANRLGDENEGWTVAKYLLEYERGVAYAAGLLADLARIIAFSKIVPQFGQNLASDHAWSLKIAELEIAIASYQGIEHAILSAVSRGEAPGPESSLLKVMSSELGQRIAMLGCEAVGYYAMPDQRRAFATGGNCLPIGPEYALTGTSRYLNSRATTIFGGASEVQRNLIAKLVIGL